MGGRDFTPFFLHFPAFSFPFNLPVLASGFHACPLELKYIMCFILGKAWKPFPTGNILVFYADSIVIYFLAFALFLVFFFFSVESPFFFCFLFICFY